MIPPLDDMYPKGYTYKVVVYQSVTGKRPFEEWLNSLKHRNHPGAAAIDARIARIRDTGHLGDSRSIGYGIFELRIHWSPGYRIYYLRQRDRIVILLCGGDKSSQTRDILKARVYADDFRRRS